MIGKMNMLLKSLAKSKRMFIPYLDSFQQFLVRVFVIGGEISPKREMAFLFQSHDSSFLQTNVFHHRQTTKLMVFGP